MFSTRVALAFVMVGCAFPQGQPTNVTIYPTPDNVPFAITKGPDGALWFTMLNKNGSAPPVIGRIGLNGTISQFPAQTPNTFDIATGPDGALWFTGSDGIRRITTTGSVTFYPTGHPTHGIATGPDGALWFTEEIGHDLSPNIGRITTSGVITEYPLPNNGTTSTLQGDGFITAGLDGALWFTVGVPFGPIGGSGLVGRITPTGSLTLYNTSTIDLRNITTGPDGALWFTEYTANKIGRISTAGTLTEYPIPNLAAPRGITTGPDGALWFTTESEIWRLTTAGAFVKYNTTACPCYNITTAADGALWFTSIVGIGRLSVGSAPTARSGVLPHIATGGAWSTVITLVNNSSSAAPLTVTFRNDDGSALSLPVTTTNQGATQTATSSSVTATISPHATLLLTTGQLASTVVGWADVSSSGPVSGYAIFRQIPQSGPASEGTVPLQIQFPTTFILPYDNTGGFVTGFAVANLSTSSATVTAVILDDNGNQLNQLDIFTIPGSGHTSFLLPTKFPTTAGKRGVISFVSSDMVLPSGVVQGAAGIAGLGLRFSPFGTFTSVPTI
jgi:streptogramin lyase